MNVLTKFINFERNTMSQKSKDSIITITAALFFVALVIYLSMQDSTAVGPL